VVITPISYHVETHLKTGTSNSKKHQTCSSYRQARRLRHQDRMSHPVVQTLRLKRAITLEQSVYIYILGTASLRYQESATHRPLCHLQTHIPQNCSSENHSTDLFYRLRQPSSSRADCLLANGSIRGKRVGPRGLGNDIAPKTRSRGKDPINVSKASC